MDEINAENLIQPEINPAIFDQIENENRENAWRGGTGLDEENLCGAVETIIFGVISQSKSKRLKN